MTKQTKKVAPTVKISLPWSVKGVTPLARKIAKEAARKNGMAIGEWLSAIIESQGQDAPGHTAANDSTQAIATEKMDEMQDRVARVEAQVAQAYAGLLRAVEQANDRLNQIEQQPGSLKKARDL